MIGEVAIRIDKLFFKNYFLIFISLILVSCGQGGGDNPEDKTQLFVAPIVEGGNPLVGSEKGVAYRICFALRAKRFQYQNSEQADDSRVFSFKHQSISCDGFTEEKEDIEVKFNKDQDDLSYAYLSSNKLFYGPLTDTQGYLSSVCHKILKGETATNVFVENKKAYEISFFSQMNGDGVRLRFGEIDKNNEFQFLTKNVHFYYVLTETTVSGDMLGLIHRAEDIKNCDNGAREVEIIQSKDL